MAADKQDIKSILKEGIEFKDISFTQKTLEKRGVDSVEEFVRGVAQEYLEQTAGDTDQSSNYFPTVLDPNIYDTGVLYGMSPMLTYLEARGRRQASDVLTDEYLQLKSGFTGEWLAENADTQGAGMANTGTATATMKFLAMPIVMSDIIGKGASATARGQLMDFAQEGLRETLDAQIVSGAAGSYSFDGLDTLATANTAVAAGAARVNLGGTAPMDLDTLNKMDTVMTDTLKSRPTVVVTSAVVGDQIEADILPSAVGDYSMPITAGIEVPYFRSDVGKIPIITDPNMPKTATNRHLAMFNERHIFIKDFMTPAYITRGKSKPFASAGWLGQVVVQYHVSPTQMVQAYGIL